MLSQNTDRFEHLAIAAFDSALQIVASFEPVDTNGHRRDACGFEPFDVTFIKSHARGHDFDEEFKGAGVPHMSKQFGVAERFTAKKR